jgi:hypothetical protein
MLFLEKAIQSPHPSTPHQQKQISHHAHKPVEVKDKYSYHFYKSSMNTLFIGHYETISL